jgi:hypothetical protein
MHWDCLTIENSNGFLVWQCLGYTFDRPASECFWPFMYLRDGFRCRAFEAQNPILEAAGTELVGD